MSQEVFKLNQVLFKIPQVAQYLEVSRGTVYNIIKTGKLKVVYLGRSPRITRLELDRFISSLESDQIVETR